MALFKKSVPETTTWRTEARPVFLELQGYGLSLSALRDTISDPESGNPLLLPRDADDLNRDALEVAGRCHALLASYVARVHPNVDSRSPLDPTRGGFLAMKVALEEAFQALTLAHSTTLGLTMYGDQVVRDGRVEEVFDAGELAAPWYNDAASFVHRLIETGSPRNVDFVRAWNHQVLDKHAQARTAYGRLYPYINGMQ